MKIETHDNGHGVEIATITINPADIDRWLRDEATDEQRDTAGWPDDDELQEGHTLHMFTEAATSVWEQIDTFGLRFDNDQNLVIVTYARDDLLDPISYQFEGIRAVTNLVFTSYEHMAPDRNNWGPMLADLGGDDDVDYSGSYIDIGLDVLMMYLKAKL